MRVTQFALKRHFGVMLFVPRYRGDVGFIDV